jgi:phage shock protein A
LGPPWGWVGGIARPAADGIFPCMLEDLQRLFRQSVDAFRAELNRREPEDQVSDLLTAMRREMVAARAALPGLEEEVRRARSELESERALVEQCERRLQMAERIGDAETVSIAREFADRHRERAGVLEQRVAAAVAEHSLRSRESVEMERKYKESDANRFSLLAQLRQQQTREKMRSRLDAESGPFADFARMEDSVRDAEAYAEAVEEVGPQTRPPPGASRASEDDLDARLEELKRRMGKG